VLTGLTLHLLNITRGDAARIEFELANALRARFREGRSLIASPMHISSRRRVGILDASLVVASPRH
jgi:hypothetical protein